MTCAEIQDRLWDEPNESHVRECAACASALEEIRTIRASLRADAAPERLAAGVLARMSRHRPVWPHAFRYCAGLAIGILAALPFRSAPPAPAPQVRIVREDPAYPQLEEVMKRLGNERPSETELLRILNESLRRRGTAVTSEPLAKLEERQ